jgi:branched-chain amino acid transport system ATP-binding protein
MKAPLLQLSGVTAFYGAIQALRGVDLEVHEGEIVTLIGANGAGKSTLMMTVCGNPHARDGKIIYDGADITRLPTHQIMRRGIAQSPEGRRIFPRMTIYENLQMGAHVTGGRDFDAMAGQVFALFPRLQERISQRGGTLSGGEQQMLAIGRGLASAPRLLMMDEPSMGLAPAVADQIFERIASIRREKKVTILLVEQRAVEALEYCDRGYVLETGRVVLSGTHDELLADDRVRKAYLGM